MDYRARSEKPPVWSEQEFQRQMLVDLYREADCLGMFQLDAPDQSTSFITCFDACTEDLSIAYYYAIEAPRSCPVRQAFEVGKISWMEFWSHKDWLLRIDAPSTGDCASRYITFEDIDSSTIRFFQNYGNNGPFLLMIKQLKSGITLAKFDGGDAMEEERDLHNFLSVHGHRLRDSAA